MTEQLGRTLKERGKRKGSEPRSSKAAPACTQECRALGSISPASSCGASHGDPKVLKLHG